MSDATRDGAWWADRLTVARGDPPDDYHAGCPSCGSRDNLHVTDRPGRDALLQCFSGCEYADVLAAVDEEAGDEPAPALKVRRTSGGARGRNRTSSPSRNSPDVGTIDPMGWLATYCGVDRTWLNGQDVEARGGDVAFTFGDLGVAKLRTPPGKEFRWEPRGAAPILWPLPAHPETEVWVTEGETDALVLRSRGLDAYAVTKGAKATLGRDGFARLRSLGVRRVVIAYDADEAGRKGSAEMEQEALAADLWASVVVPPGYDPITGAGKDWRDWGLAGGTDLPEPEPSRTEVVALLDVEDSPPEALRLGYLDPHDHTILFGDGGTGKGVLAAWWAAQLVAEGEVVLIVDYERHARHEWRPRVKAFGGVEALAHVWIVQPTEAIWDVVESIRAEADRVEATWVVVDSAAYACVGEEPEKSIAATQYTLAIVQLERPVLTLAHVTKADSDPRWPFGSTYWHNGARQTIGMSGRDDEPRILKSRKSNLRAGFPTAEVDWSWVRTDGPPPSELTFRPHRGTSTEVLALEEDWATAELASLAERTGLTVNTVKSARSKLKEAGLVGVKRVRADD